MSRKQPVASRQNINEAAYFIQRVNNILQNQLTGAEPTMPHSATAKQNAPELQPHQLAKQQFGTAMAKAQINHNSTHDYNLIGSRQSRMRKLERSQPKAETSLGNSH